jgi:hypothetical protein
MQPSSFGPSTHNLVDPKRIYSEIRFSVRPGQADDGRLLYCLFRELGRTDNKSC